jgi:hypothetical protein
VHVAMSLIKHFDLNTGHEVNAVNAHKRVCGILYVFETEAAAREMFGDVKTVEVSFAEPKEQTDAQG